MTEIVERSAEGEEGASLSAWKQISERLSHHLRLHAPNPHPAKAAIPQAAMEMPEASSCSSWYTPSLPSYRQPLPVGN